MEKKDKVPLMRKDLTFKTHKTHIVYLSKKTTIFFRQHEETYQNVTIFFRSKFFFNLFHLDGNVSLFLMFELF